MAAQELTIASAWEASFFGFSIQEIKVGTDPDDNLASELLSTIEQAEDDALLKVSVDAQQLHVLPLLERQGFELWETRFTWLTTWSRAQLRQNHDLKPKLPGDRVVWGSERHQQAILDMTNEHLAKSTAVVNRFDSPFYPEGSSETWYAKWITRSCKTPGAGGGGRTRRNREVAGYFIYLPGEPQDGVDVYKGILSVIPPASRPKPHVHLQQFLFEEMAKRHERVTLDNTTRVSNYPVIRNHAKSGRRPDHIELVMFRGPHRR